MRIMPLIGVVVGLSVAVPMILQGGPESVPAVDAPQAARVPGTGETPSSRQAVSAPGRRTVTLDADRDGHFRTEMRFNGRKVDALIDTGASLVAMNETTARKAGITVPRSAFKHAVNTANGTARAAVVRIDLLEVGRIRIAGVDAVVMEDKALATTLIGMNVLKQLARFEIKDGVLVLEQ